MKSEWGASAAPSACIVPMRSVLIAAVKVAHMASSLPTPEAKQDEPVKEA